MTCENRKAEGGAAVKKTIAALMAVALGAATIVVPPFAAWINATFGGPAIPAVSVSLLGVIAGSLLSPRDMTPDAQRVAAVLAARGAA